MEALKIAKHLGNHHVISRTLNNIAEIHYIQENLPKALEMYKLNKKERFTIRSTVDQCKRVIISRIEDKINKTS